MAAHCPRTPHTHARIRRRAAPSAAQPNMLQHLPKESENECKLRLFYAPRHLCLALVITIGGGWGGGVAGAGGRGGGSASDICQQKSKKKKKYSLLHFPFPYKPDLMEKRKE